MMKFEFEVDERVMNAALQAKVADEVRQRVSQWGSDAHIKQRVAAMWSAEVDRIIAEQLSKHDELKAKVAAAVEKKLRAKLEAAIRLQEAATSS
jgi:S-methylmethionine-dependent homocysteine/selenocysteine methylase